MGYKVLFRFDLDGDNSPDVVWEPGCPVVFDAIQVSRNTETGEAFLQARIRNISPRKVGEVSLEYRMKEGGEENATQTVELLDADIPAGKTLDLVPLKLECSKIDSVSYRIVKADNWSFSSDALPLPESPSLALSTEAMQERKETLSEESTRKAVPNAEKGILNDDDWWRCSCGALNVGRKKCWSCSFSKERLETLESENVLLEQAKERAAKKAAAKAAREKKTKIGAVAAACVAIVLALICFVAMPAYHVSQQNQTATGQGGWVVTKMVTHDTKDDSTSTLEYELDGFGNVVEAREYDGDSGTPSVTKYNCDANGVPVSCSGKYPYKQTVEENDESGCPSKIVRTSQLGTETYTYTYGEHRHVLSSSYTLEYSGDSFTEKDTRDSEYTFGGWLKRRESSFTSTISSVKDSHYTDTYEYSQNSGKVISAICTDQDKKKTNYRYEYTENGNVSKVFENNKLKTEYEYTYVDNLSPAAFASSRLVLQTALYR